LAPPERILQILREDYVTDALSWSELMSRHLSGSSVLKAPSFQPGRIKTRTLLMAEIVAPAVRQVGAVLKERDFSPRKVEYSGFKETIPALYVDKNRFEEVFFNLLDNAIKYAYDDPSRFHVEIVGSREGMDFLIECRDWGSGIPPGWEELIFQEGLRGPTAVDQDVQGQGLGLWIVRQIIEAHGGSVRLTRNAQPTQFTARLPGYLANRPPVEEPPGGGRGAE
jgi:signal transduction histidine kinase